MAQQKAGSLEVLIGVFVLAGIAGVMTLILSVSNLSFLGGETYKIVVELKHIEGLKEGAPVTLSGYPIGKVETIRLAKTHTEIVIEVAMKQRIQTDARVQITKAGLVGDTYLEFSRGDSETYLEQVKDVESAPHVKGEAAPSMNELIIRSGEILEKVKVIGDEVTLLVENMNKIIGDEQVQEDIKTSVRNIASTTREAEKLLVNLNKSSESVQRATGKIEDAATDISLATRDARRMITVVSQMGLADLLSDNKMADRIVAKWVHENRRLNAEQMALEWKRFVAEQKAMYPFLRDPKYADGIPPWKREQFEEWKRKNLKLNEDFKEIDKDNR